MAKQKTAAENRRKTAARPRETAVSSFIAGVSTAWRSLENVADSRLVFWICAALLPLAVLAYYPSSEALHSDHDLWFHLAYGRHYVENLTWDIDHSMFSWTPAASTSSYVSWLGASLFFITQKVMGVPGLFALHHLVFLASAAVIFLFARAANVRPGLGLLVGILMVAITIRIAGQYIKPEMFSTFLVTLTVALYLRFRMDPKPWIMAAFPLVFLFWVNTHGLWQFGIVFLGIVFAVDLLLYVIRRDQSLGRKALMYLTGSIGLSFLALCVNPHGPSLPFGFVWGRILQVVSIFVNIGDAGSGEVLGYYRSISAYQNMWEHLFFTGREFFYTVSSLLMLVMAIVFATVWRISWKRSGHAELPVAAANIFFFFMAMFMGRLLLIFPLLWIFSLIYLAWRAGNKPFLPQAAPVFLALFIVLIGYVGFTVGCIYADRSWFGKGYRDYVPDKETEYILENNLPGPMFNDYLSGGYLMWAMYPKYKVFIDPRQFPYREEVYPDYLGLGTKFSYDQRGFRAFMEKYPASFALIHHGQQLLIQWFRASPDWTMAYFDAAAVIMIRKDLLPGLSAGARSAMRGPAHYKDIDNPVVLSHLFHVYLNFLGSHYGSQIRDIYEQNVSACYVMKKIQLAVMDRALVKRREIESRKGKMKTNGSMP